MKHRRRIARPVALGIFAALLVLSSPVLAPDTALGQGHGSFVGTVLQMQAIRPAKKKPIKNRKQLKPVNAHPLKAAKAQAPELDPSAFGSAAVLLLGGTLVAIGRRRRAGERLCEGSAEGRPS